MKEIKDVTASNPSPEQNAPRVEIQAQYLKNISFDSPIVPGIFKKLKEAPKVDLGLDLQVKETEPSLYEVTILFNIKATQDIETVFTTNIEYSGLFKIDNVAK